MQTAIQLYTVRDVEKPYLDVLGDVGETSFDGVEFANRVSEAEYGDVRAALDEHGLLPTSAHVGLDALRDDLDGVVEAARALGHDDVVLSWLDPEYFESVAAVEETAEMLSAFRARLADEDLAFHYHNHDQEFAETEEGFAFDVLADRTDDVLFEVDAGWALAGGADPNELLDRYADRITHVHVKDVNLDSESVPALGEGDLDVGAVADVAAAIDAEWLVYENDEPRDPAAAPAHGASVLNESV